MFVRVLFGQLAQKPPPLHNFSGFGRDFVQSHWYIKREEVERYAAERLNSGKPFKDEPPAPAAGEE